MMVPCQWPFGLSVWLRLYQPRSFRTAFVRSEKWFRPAQAVFRSIDPDGTELADFRGRSKETAAAPRGTAPLAGAGGAG
jgi:hypothetical protein